MSGEDTTKNLWDKLGNLYQSKSLVNKFFLWKKLYLLRMSDGYSIKESQLLSVNININEEEKYINMLCSFPNAWDSLVMDIRSNNTTLKLDNVVAALLSKEMREKNMEGSTLEDLSVRGRSVIRKKGKPSSGRSKSKGKSKSRSKSKGKSKSRSTSPAQSKGVC